MTPALKHLQHGVLFNEARFGDGAEYDSLAPSLVSNKSYGESLLRGSISRD